MKKKLFIRKNSKMNYYSEETSVSNTHFPSCQVSLTTHEKILVYSCVYSIPHIQITE